MQNRREEVGLSLPSSLGSDYSFSRKSIEATSSLIFFSRRSIRASNVLSTHLVPSLVLMMTPPVARTVSLDILAVTFFSVASEIAFATAVGVI